MKFRDSHPSNQELLLAADAELSDRRIEEIKSHLTTCWECRVRMQELEGAIGDFVRIHHGNFDPLLPPVSGSRALLKAQLDQLASSDPSGSRQRLQLFSWRRIIQLSMAASVVAFIFVVTLGRWPSRGEPTMYASFVPMSVPTATVTPGVAQSATREQVCTGNQGKNRDVPVALRRRVFDLYGIPRADPRAYEVDYLITPALGGSDDIRNLWPQSYSATIWNARVKDDLEERLHELVCAGDLDLETAQQQISTDWIAAYKKYFRTDRPIESQ